MYYTTISDLKSSLKDHGVEQNKIETLVGHINEDNMSALNDNLPGMLHGIGLSKHDTDAITTSLTNHGFFSSIKETFGNSTESMGGSMDDMSDDVSSQVNNMTDASKGKMDGMMHDDMQK
jgi:hypothetical protein